LELGSGRMFWRKRKHMADMKMERGKGGLNRTSALREKKRSEKKVFIGGGARRRPLRKDLVSGVHRRKSSCLPWTKKKIASYKLIGAEVSEEGSMKPSRTNETEKL